MALTTRGDEEIIVDTRMSWLGALLDWKAIITLGLWMFVNRYGSRYQVTDQRVYRRYGIISKAENTVSNEDVREVELRQGILARIFRYGTVRISTAATAGSEIDFKKVGSPASVQREVDQIIQNNR